MIKKGRKAYTVENLYGERKPDEKYCSTDEICCHYVRIFPSCKLSLLLLLQGLTVNCKTHEILLYCRAWSSKNLPGKGRIWEKDARTSKGVSGEPRIIFLAFLVVSILAFRNIVCLSRRAAIRFWKQVQDALDFLNSYSWELKCVNEKRLVKTDCSTQERWGACHSLVRYLPYTYMSPHFCSISFIRFLITILTLIQNRFTALIMRTRAGYLRVGFSSVGKGFKGMICQDKVFWDRVLRCRWVLAIFAVCRHDEKSRLWYQCV